MALRIQLQLPVVGTFDGAVWGDEVMAIGLANALRKLDEVESAEVVSPQQTDETADVVVDFYCCPELRAMVRARQVWWFQAPRITQGVPTTLLGEHSKTHYHDVLYAGTRLGELVKSWSSGFRTMFFPMAADADVYQPVAGVERTKPVVFVGNARRSPIEIEWFAGLVPLGLELYGVGWEAFPELSPAVRGPIHPGLVPELYSSAKVVIAHHQTWHRLHDTPTSRLFEAALCGCCIVSDHLPLAEKMRTDTVQFVRTGEEAAAATSALLAGRTYIEKGAAARDLVKRRWTFTQSAPRLVKFLLDNDYVEPIDVLENIAGAPKMRAAGSRLALSA